MIRKAPYLLALACIVQVCPHGAHGLPMETDPFPAFEAPSIPLKLTMVPPDTTATPSANGPTGDDITSFALPPPSLAPRPTTKRPAASASLNPIPAPSDAAAEVPSLPHATHSTHSHPVGDVDAVPEPAAERTRSPRGGTVVLRESRRAGPPLLNTAAGGSGDDAPTQPRGVDAALLDAAFRVSPPPTSSRTPYSETLLRGGPEEILPQGREGLGAMRDGVFPQLLAGGAILPAAAPSAAFREGADDDRMREPEKAGPQLAAGPEGLAAAAAPPVGGGLAGEYAGMSAAELDAVFAGGDAVIPGHGQPGEWEMCKGELLLNALRPASKGGAETAEPLHRAYQHLWYGKTFFTEAQGNILNINLLYTNASVASLSDPVLKAEGITPDGRPSVIISYRYTHDVVWPDDTVDEFRQVAPSTYLGKVWVARVVRSLVRSPLSVALAPIDTTAAAESAVATAHAIYSSIGLGPDTDAYLPHGGAPPKGFAYGPLLYFVLHCAPNAPAKLDLAKTPPQAGIPGV